MYQVDDYVDEYGLNPYSEWKLSVKPDQARTAISRVSCLKYAGMKCPFVKDLKLEKMYELRAKTDKVRVYFFKHHDTFIILGAGLKETQRQDIADCLERMHKMKRILTGNSNHEYSKETRKKIIFNEQRRIRSI